MKIISLKQDSFKFVFGFLTLVFLWAKLPGIQPLCCRSCCLVTKACPTLLWPQGLFSTRFLCPWDFPGKNTGVGCHFFLQKIFSTQRLNPCLLHWQGLFFFFYHWATWEAIFILSFCKPYHLTLFSSMLFFVIYLVD